MIQQMLKNIQKFTDSKSFLIWVHNNHLNTSKNAKIHRKIAEAAF